MGLDAYRMWDRWADQRIGARAYMRSTYDRTGLNEAADASHFLYHLADDQNVALDVEGQGVLCFGRTNHWHDSPWRYTADFDTWCLPSQRCAVASLGAPVFMSDSRDAESLAVANQAPA